MKSKLNIQINDPCHENWDQMSSVEKGRFCGVCNKVVVDFTKYTDEQLFDYFSNRKSSSTGNLCGRFAAEKVTVPTKIEVSEKSYYQLKSSLQRFLWLWLVSIGLIVISCNNGQPKGKVDLMSTPGISQTVDSVVNRENLKEDNKIVGKMDPTPNVSRVVPCVSGEVTEVMGEPEMVVMGGIMPPEIISGDTILKLPDNQPHREVMGKVATPKWQNQRNSADSGSLKQQKGE